MSQQLVCSLEVEDSGEVYVFPQSQIRDELSDSLNRQRHFFFSYKTFCRELVLSWLNRESLRDHAVTLNVSCTGYMYCEVARILLNKEAHKKLSKNLSRIFGQKIIVHPFKMDSDKYPLFKEEKRTRNRVTYITNHGLTLAVRFDANRLLISSLLFLLREPKIVLDLVNGRITTMKDLVNYLLIFSGYRYNKNTESFWDKDSFETKGDFKEFATEPFNSYGSDSISIALMAVFLAVNSYGIGKEIDNLYSGPVDFALSDNSYMPFQDYLVKNPDTAKIYHKISNKIGLREAVDALTNPDTDDDDVDF